LDYEQAVFWYSRASLQGDADAQNNLGHCYSMGHGVSTNAVEALAYFILASPHSERARQNAQILRSSSTGELVKQSQERAKQLQREIEAGSNSK
jgi:TPR repeat protein